MRVRHTFNFRVRIGNKCGNSHVMARIRVCWGISYSKILVVGVRVEWLLDDQWLAPWLVRGLLLGDVGWEVGTDGMSGADLRMVELLSTERSLVGGIGSENSLLA
jgi:hypothetical protein